MKEKIHPNYEKITVQCTCGNNFITGSAGANKNLKIEVCSKCHPFYTGKQKVIDTGGRVKGFNDRYLKKNVK